LIESRAEILNLLGSRVIYTVNALHGIQQHVARKMRQLAKGSCGSWDMVINRIPDELPAMHTTDTGLGQGSPVKPSDFI
jgi:hypothetical protein